jgi:putative glutamine amidotransferase
VTDGDRVLLEDVIPDLPMPENPRAHICVIGSLNFPGIGAEDIGLVKRFTRTALTTLVELGAAYELWDSTEELETPADTAQFDGLLMLGGGDIDGVCYGVTAPNPTAYGVDARADRDALAAIAAAEAADVPVFGICRGVQLLNVARGGTIVPDIADFALHHGAPGDPVFVDEPIDITPGTRLAAILAADRVIGRNGHHQAVDRVGERLVVAGRALDGIIESVEDPERWYLGVQWHPEDDDGSRADRMRLFGAFVDAAEQTRQDRVA